MFSNFSPNIIPFMS